MLGSMYRVASRGARNAKWDKSMLQQIRLLNIHEYQVSVWIYVPLHTIMLIRRGDAGRLICARLIGCDAEAYLEATA